MSLKRVHLLIESSRVPHGNGLIGGDVNKLLEKGYRETNIVAGSGKQQRTDCTIPSYGIDFEVVTLYLLRCLVVVVGSSVPATAMPNELGNSGDPPYDSHHQFFVIANRSEHVLIRCVPVNVLLDTVSV